MSSTRFPPIRPSQLTPSQQPHQETCVRFGSNMGPFTYQNPEGALLGPFALLLYTPSLISSSFELTRLISSLPSLPPRHRELAILATGAVHHCVYELYAHTRVALALPERPFSRSQVADAVEGRMPEGLSGDEEVAWRFSWGMAGSRGVMPAEVGGGKLEGEGKTAEEKGAESKRGWKIGFNEAEKVLGREGVLALMHTVGNYSYLCLMLNVGDVGLPAEGILPQEREIGQGSGPEPEV